MNVKEKPQYIESLGKGWEIYWLQAFKEISILSFADYLVNWV